MGNLKLPHWAQLVLAFASVAVVWVMQRNASGDLVLPAAAVSALTIINTVIGLFSAQVSADKQVKP